MKQHPQLARRVRAAAGVIVIPTAIMASVTAEPGFAAVRTCGPIASSAIVTAATEPEAKKGALDQWKEKARALGPGYDSWQLAASRSLKCFPKNGAFECVAFGAPCVIQQNPSQKPAGRDRKGLPL